MTKSRLKKRKNAAHPKDIRAGIVANPIMSIKPLLLLPLMYARIAPVMSWLFIILIAIVHRKWLNQFQAMISAVF
jgi:hypothetical protein